MLKLSLAFMLVSVSFVALAGLQGIASAQQHSITFPLREDSNPEIDGVWTSAGEWSMAGETLANYTDGSRLLVRGMHDSDFLYVMLEMPDDYIVDGHAGLCIDTLGDGGAYLRSDDYCFVMGSALREYHGDDHTTLMQQEPLDPFVAAQRGLSDSKSPLYSSKGHMTYEFRIPLEYIGSDKTEYGFYVSFDTRGQTNNYNFYYSWPDYKSAEYLRVASPRSWGIISLSPDANVPEFPIPLVGALSGIVGAVAVLTRMKFLKF